MWQLRIMYVKPLSIALPTRAAILSYVSNNASSLLIGRLCLSFVSPAQPKLTSSSPLSHPQLLIEPPTPTTPYPTLSGLLSPTHPIIDGSQKRLHLESLSAENHIPLHETLVVGDGANDLEMLNLAGSHGGLGVAFRAKEKVQREVSE